LLSFLVSESGGGYGAEDDQSKATNAAEAMTFEEKGSVFAYRMLQESV